MTRQGSEQLSQYYPYKSQEQISGLYAMLQYQVPVNLIESKHIVASELCIANTALDKTVS
jgi:hypothetical protein